MAQEEKIVEAIVYVPDWSILYIIYTRRILKHKTVVCAYLWPFSVCLQLQPLLVGSALLYTTECGTERIHAES